MNNAMRRRAFTLVELLVVIAIIGLLSTIAAVSLGTARSKGKDTKRIADLKQVRSALDMYYQENGVYPTCGQACATYCDCTTVGWGASWTTMEIRPTYIASMPVDPTNTSAYGYFYARGYKPTGNCSWQNTNLPSDYIIATNLELPNSASDSCPGGFTAWGRTLNFLSGGSQ